MRFGKIHIILPPHLTTLVTVVIFAFILGLIPLFSQLYFTFDQSRDAYEAYHIWHDHNLKIIGPATDIPGLFHGVLWNYMLAIPYALSNNDPNFTVFFFFILAFCSIPFIYYASYKITKSHTIALVSVIFYVFSPLFQAASRWLSNPYPAILITPVLLFSIWNYLERPSKTYAFAVGIFFGLMTQANLAYGLLLFTLPLYWLVFHFRLRPVDVILFLAGLGMGLSTFIISEIKFKWMGFKSVLEYVHSKPHGDLNVVTYIEKVLDRSADLLEVSSFPVSRILLLLLIPLLIYCIRKSEDKEKKVIYFLLIWLLNIPLYLYFSTGISNSHFLFFPSLFPIILLTAYLLVFLLKKQTIMLYVVMTSIVVLQVVSNISYINDKSTVLTLQKGALLPDQHKVIDYTYQQAKGEPFLITTITNPLFINTTWAFAYEFYGKKRNNYLPLWDGPDQTGYNGNLPLKGKQKVGIRFLIIDPPIGLPEFMIEELIEQENTKSTLIERKKIGGYEVQKRLEKNM